jgi:hypothetical protein
MILAAAPAAARDPQLGLPIDCTLGDTCFIQNLIDHDASPVASDFRCGTLTYDAHTGTDFALPSLAARTAGVNVIASAPGTVRALRDGMPDIPQGGPDAPEITDQDCGNGVVLTHDDGWETQYCHLEQGSVSVAVGDQVAAGAVLGRVGLSGNTSFPHVHLALRHNGDVVDPFDPDGGVTCNTPPARTLWRVVPEAPAGGIITAGFSAGIPEYSEVKAGTVNSGLGSRVPMVFWAYFFGSQTGDTVRITINGPDGAQVFDTTETLDRGQAQFFRAGGRRTPEGGWATGTYNGVAVLSRNGTEIDRITATGQIN